MSPERLTTVTKDRGQATTQGRDYAKRPDDRHLGVKQADVRHPAAVAAVAAVVRHGRRDATPRHGAPAPSSASTATTPTRPTRFCRRHPNWTPRPSTMLPPPSRSPPTRTRPTRLPVVCDGAADRPGIPECPGPGLEALAAGGNGGADRGFACGQHRRWPGPLRWPHACGDPSGPSASRRTAPGSAPPSPRCAGSGSAPPGHPLATPARTAASGRCSRPAGRKAMPATAADAGVVNASRAGGVVNSGRMPSVTPKTLLCEPVPPPHPRRVIRRRVAAPTRSRHPPPARPTPCGWGGLQPRCYPTTAAIAPCASRCRCRR
jgi:hypothetical protein